MTIFKTNFSNPLPKTNNEDPCYWIIYKPITHAMICNDKSISVNLPVAPEKINHHISDEWWAANQSRVQQIVPCDSVAPDIDSSGRIPFCVISSYDDPNLNSTRDCTLLYPEEQQLIQFLQNNNCDMNDLTNPVVIWYNDILSNNRKISSSPQQFFNSFTEACNNCNVFCTTCVPFSESVLVSSLLESNGSTISGNNILIEQNNIDLNNYFDTNLRPIVLYSKDSAIGQFASSNSQLSSFNFNIPLSLGFNKALFINKQGQVSSKDVIPGQIISLSNKVILGSTNEQLPVNLEPIIGQSQLSTGDKLPPSPPTILSFRTINGESGSSTVILLAPNPRISNEDVVTSYVFRFQGVAFTPIRIGPAPAIQDGPEQLLENEYEFDGILEGQYASVASVGSNSIGLYGDPLFLGQGCCYISNGAVFDGTEESCQEYSGDRELSYTWSENSCVPTGSWNTGHLFTNSGLFKDKFYITGSQSGSFDDWISYYGSGTATNFRRNIEPSVLATGTVYDSFRMVPTGDNINIIISPDISVTFSKVLSEGSISIQQTANNFSFFTTATTSGNIGFDISKPTGFLEGNEIVGLGDDGSLTSLPFSLTDNRINSSNIFTNITHYGKYKTPLPGGPEEDCDTGTQCPGGCIPEANWFCCPDNIHVAMTAEDCPGFNNLNVGYNVQTEEYAPAVMPREGTFAVFGFAPSGFGFVSQFAQHYINLISAHSDQVYFVDSKGSKINLDSYVSTSYLRFHPEPIVVPAALSLDNNFETLGMDPPIGWLDPNMRDVDPVGLVVNPIVTDLFFIPCENPFYTRGGYNIHDLFTFECGCWITLVTRKELLDFAVLLASYYLAVTRISRLLAGLGAEYATKLIDLNDLENLKDSYLKEGLDHKKVVDLIEATYPGIEDSFDPRNLPPGWVVVGSDQLMNPTMNDVLQYWEIDEDGVLTRLSWDEYLGKYPEATALHDLDDIYSEWQRHREQQGYMYQAYGRARGLDQYINPLKTEVSALNGQIDTLWAQLSALYIALAAYQAQLGNFMQGPAVSFKKECPIESFAFCKHNFIYDICGGQEGDRGYWQRGYDPDGFRHTLPQGWPSCDCCAPCESCNPDPPSLGWSGFETPSLLSPCQICPPEYTIMPGQPGPDYYVPLGDPPENPLSDTQCANNRAAVCCFVGNDPDLQWNESNWSLWPFTDGPHWTNVDGVWGCYYTDPSTGFSITKEHYFAKRCCSGECVGFCDDPCLDFNPD